MLDFILIILNKFQNIFGWDEGEILSDKFK